MNKKFLLQMIVLTFVLTSSGVYASEDNIPASQNNGGLYAEQANRDFNHPQRHGHGKGEFHKYHPSKEEMEKKKAEIEKRLQLTDEQKKYMENNRKKGHEKVKPIMEEKHSKMQEMRKIREDNTLTQEEKQKKIEDIHTDIKKLNEKANKYREENMKAFEKTLTEEQKQEFNKIKQEQKQEIEKRRAAFEERKKNKEPKNVNIQQ